MMSVTTNNKRCKGASFPKLFQKCKMGTKTLHFLLWAELSEFAVQRTPHREALKSSDKGQWEKSRQRDEISDLFFKHLRKSHINWDVFLWRPQKNKNKKTNVLKFVRDCRPYKNHWIWLIPRRTFLLSFKANQEYCVGKPTGWTIYLKLNIRMKTV